MEGTNGPEMGSSSVFSKIKDNFFSKDHQKEKTPPKIVTNTQEQLPNKEYSKDEIKEIFKEENLASLSLEKYIDLLRQFPSEMVTHVTRQGVRDHVGMAYHTAGLGEYSDGFIKLVTDGRLKPAIGIDFNQGNQEEAINDVLELNVHEINIKEEALLALDKFIKNEPIAGGYADKMAVHFAAEEVVDAYYGSESENEIFIVYPSILIASQYKFTGKLNEAGGGYHNNKWVWANGEKGMDLNSGIVFIPKDARVDYKTGSRYELDENKQSVINETNVKTYTDFVNSDSYFDFMNQLMDIDRNYDSGPKTHKSFQNKESERLTQEVYQPYRDKLEKEFNITDRWIQDAIFDSSNRNMIKRAKEDIVLSEEIKNPELIKSSNNYLKKVIKSTLRNSGCLYVEAQKTVSSEEFWEDYFSKNITKKPSKIVYYKGFDPTTVLKEWCKKYKIEKKSNDPNMGFLENMSDYQSPEAMFGVDEFKTIAEKVINERFAV